MTIPSTSRRVKLPAERQTIMVPVRGGCRIQEICRSAGATRPVARLSRFVFPSERAAQIALFRGQVQWFAWSKRRR